MKRWFLRIILFLLPGAIVNIAVAWGCAEYSPRSIKEYQPSADQQEFWRARVSRLSPDLKSHAYVCIVESGFGVTNQSSGCLMAYGHRSQEVGAEKQFSAGYPNRCLRGRVVVTALGAATYETSGLWFVRRVQAFTFQQPLSWATSTDYFRAVPASPIWPGFVINTVFYAVILWLIFATPFALRRRMRIKRGWCRRCAYDLRATRTSVCPECGATR